MFKISSLDKLSLNYCQNAQLQKKYDRHVNKIIQISEKKSKVQQVAQDMKKVSQDMKKAKLISRSFKEKQFLAQRQLEENRLKKTLHLIHSRPRLRTQPILQRTNSKPTRFVKQQILRSIQVQRQNKCLAHNIIERAMDVQKYKKRIEKEIAQYVQLRSHLQRLKPATSTHSRPFHLQNQPTQTNKIKVKTQRAENSNKAVGQQLVKQ